MAEQVLAHTIVYDGREYPMSVATLCDDGRISIAPYTHETPSTRFYSGRILLTTDGSRLIATPCRDEAQATDSASKSE